MPDFTAGQYVFLIAIAAFTLTAAYYDSIEWRIPNWLNVGFFATGLIYQPVFNGWEGLADGLLGFAIGFGLFFMIWAIGSGGGGDVKLMGALSVWLGWKKTLILLAVLVPLVIFLSIVLAVIRKIKKGVAREYTDAEFDEKPKNEQRTKKKKSREEKVKALQKRRLMAFAVPVGIATWLVVFLTMWKILPERYW